MYIWTNRPFIAVIFERLLSYKKYDLNRYDIIYWTLNDLRIKRTFLYKCDSRILSKHKTKLTIGNYHLWFEKFEKCDFIKCIKSTVSRIRNVWCGRLWKQTCKITKPSINGSIMIERNGNTLNTFFFCINVAKSRLLKIYQIRMHVGKG